MVGSFNVQGAAREEDRWQQIELKKKDDEEYVRRLRDDGLACKKNTSNVAYDILNLQYNQDTSGEQQKYEDDMGTSKFYYTISPKYPFYIKQTSRSSFFISSLRDQRRLESEPSATTLDHFVLTRIINLTIALLI